MKTSALVSLGEYKKHARPYDKRRFAKKERKAAKAAIKAAA